MLISCPVCRRQVDPEVHACPACGHPLSAVPTAGSPPAAPGREPAKVSAGTSQPAHLVTSNVQPLREFVLLQICSFGLYDLIWFYRSWSLLKKRHRLYITPAARSLFKELFAVHFSREIYKLSTEAGSKPRWSPFVIGFSFIVLNVLSMLCMRQSGLGLYLLGVALYVGSVCVRLPLVRALNTFWRHEQPGLPERTHLSGAAAVVVLIGILFWIMSISSVFQSKP